MFCPPREKMTESNFIKRESVAHLSHSTFDVQIFESDEKKKFRDKRSNLFLDAVRCSSLSLASSAALRSILSSPISFFRNNETRASHSHLSHFTHTHTQTDIHSHSHTETHTATFTHTHTHAMKHIHTHTLICVVQSLKNSSQWLFFCVEKSRLFWPLNQHAPILLCYAASNQKMKWNCRGREILFSVATF